MQAIGKWVLQALILPLIKAAFGYALKRYNEYVELKRLRAENKIKGDNYEKAPVDTAADDFSKLP
jgi:hypothetical protein